MTRGKTDGHIDAQPCRTSASVLFPVSLPLPTRCLFVHSSYSSSQQLSKKVGRLLLCFCLVLLDFEALHSVSHVDSAKSYINVKQLNVQ